MEEKDEEENEKEYLRRPAQPEKGADGARIHSMGRLNSFTQFSYPQRCRPLRAGSVGHPNPFGYFSYPQRCRPLRAGSIGHANPFGYFSYP